MRIAGIFVLAVSAVGIAAAPKSLPIESQTWDAIIVGGGPAGIVLADRLSSAGKMTLLLEQGGPSYYITGGRERPNWLSGTNLSRVDVPGLYSSIFSESSTMRCPSEHVNGAFLACTIGGQTAINAGLYFQPPAADWDTYFPQGWHSADMKAPTQRVLQRLPSVTHPSRNTKLYLQSGYDAARQWLVNSLGYRDISINANPDDKRGVFGHTEYNYIDSQRGGPVRTYLQTALARSNFLLQLGARAKYIVRTRAGVATGVQVEIGGVVKTVSLRSGGKVILSGGAMRSPQLLMYSGIGPSDMLTSLSSNTAYMPYARSDWIVNPSVGVGLFDNPLTFIEFSSPTVQAYKYGYNTSPTSADQQLYLNSRDGPYAFAGQTSVFWDYISHSDGSSTGMQGTFTQSGTYNAVNNPNAITLTLWGSSGMRSSGRVTLSTDGKFTAVPSGSIFYGQSRDADDVAQFIYKIFQALPPSSPQAPAKTGLTPLSLARDSTLDQIRAYIKQPSSYAVVPTNHWSSSCKMGSCVGTDTRVVGTTNIHVVDASIIPPLTVNPQFGVMIVAERAADLLLASAWG